MLTISWETKQDLKLKAISDFMKILSQNVFFCNIFILRFSSRKIFDILALRSITNLLNLLCTCGYDL